MPNSLLTLYRDLIRNGNPKEEAFFDVMAQQFAIRDQHHADMQQQIDALKPKKEPK